MFKVGQKVIYPQTDAQFYLSRGFEVKPYGKIRSLRKSSLTGNFVARIDLGAGIMLTFFVSELKPYVINEPDHVQ